MSEQRFNRIEERLDRLDGRMDKLDGRMNGLDGRMDGFDARMDRLENRVGDVDRYMHVLHEDVIARIAAIPEYSGPTRTEFAEFRELIERRLDPLERLVRQHDADIERLKRSRR
jgi:archaellum component FlaC